MNKLRSFLKGVLLRAALAGVSVLLLLGALEAFMRVAAVPGDSARALLAERQFDFLAVDPAREHPWTQGCPDPLVLAVVGDSFTRGVGVQPFDRYGSRLEAMLNMNAGCRPAEVHVFGQPGSSTYQQLRLVRQALERKPRVVILGICLNDTEDWRKPDDIARWRAGFMPRPPRPALRGIIRRSRILSWIYAKRDALRNRSGYVRYFQRLYDPQYSGFKLFTKGIGDIKAACDAAHTPLVAAIIPLLSRDLGPNRYPFGFVHERIQAVLREGGVACLDLLPRFQGARPERMQVLPGVDPHPNEIAHQLIAQGLLDFLLESGLIDKAYRPAIGDPQIHRDWETVARRMYQPLDARGSP